MSNILSLNGRPVRIGPRMAAAIELLLQHQAWLEGVEYGSAEIHITKGGVLKLKRTETSAPMVTEKRAGI